MGCLGRSSSAPTATVEFESILEKFYCLLGAPTPPSVSSLENPDEHRLIPLIVCNITAPLNQSDVIL